jgi:hypothetical protein
MYVLINVLIYVSINVSKQSASVFKSMGLRQISMKKETDLSNLSLFTPEQEPAISNPSL